MSSQIINSGLLTTARIVHSSNSLRPKATLGQWQVTHTLLAPKRSPLKNGVHVPEPMVVATKPNSAEATALLVVVGEATCNSVPVVKVGASPRTSDAVVASNSSVVLSRAT